MNFFLKRYAESGHNINPEKISLRAAIRINTIKLPEQVIVERLKNNDVRLEKIPFLKQGYWADADFSLSSTQEYLQGHYYIQESASQIPVEVLNPKPGELVLDTCAAPGSKTTQLAQWMENKGMLVALDSNSNRIVALKNNIERCGVSNCVVYQKDAAHADDLNIKFDKILIDAPCSGNLATDKEWLNKRTPDGVKSMSGVQQEILFSATLLLKPGGTVLYSTCSLEPEEDEEIIEWALDNLPLKLEDSGLDVGSPGSTERTNLCRKLWPDKDGTQGFFVAKLIKKNN